MGTWQWRVRTGRGPGETHTLPPRRPHSAPSIPAGTSPPPPGHPLPSSSPDSSQLCPPPPFLTSGLPLLPSSRDTEQGTPSRPSGSGRVPPPWDPGRAQPPLSPSPLRHPAPNSISGPCRPVPMPLTCGQGEKAERKDGAVHAVALPPRALPHHVLDQRLQLAQQRLGPAAFGGLAPRGLHGLRARRGARGGFGGRGECLRRRATRSASGGGPGRSHAPAGDTGPGCHGARRAPERLLQRAAAAQPGDTLCAVDRNRRSSRGRSAGAAGAAGAVGPPWSENQTCGTGRGRGD